MKTQKVKNLQDVGHTWLPDLTSQTAAGTIFAQVRSFNPLMSKRYFSTSKLFIVLKKPMLQAANTDLFNPLVPKFHNSVCQNLLFP